MFESRYAQYSHSPIGIATLQPFVSSDIFADRDSFGGVLQAHWLISNGWSINVVESDDFQSPLWMSFNDQTLIPSTMEKQKDVLCLKTSWQNYEFWPLNMTDRAKKSLEYKICNYGNVKESWSKHLQSIQFSSSSPDVNMIEQPIWSTWAEFKRDVNQSAVILYANRIGSILIGLLFSTILSNKLIKKPFY